MSEHGGPPMICATRALKAGPTRIGRLGVALPRPVTLTTLLGVGAGLVFGVIVAAVTAPGLKAFVFTGGIGAMAGWLVVNYSPLQGESLMKWLGLSVRSLTKRRYIEGKPVIVCVGIAEVSRLPRGSLYLRRGSVRVPAQSYDDRGVLLVHRRNVASAIDVGDPDETTRTLAEAPGPGRGNRETTSGQAYPVVEGLPPVSTLPKDNL